MLQRLSLSRDWISHSTQLGFIREYAQYTDQVALDRGQGKAISGTLTSIFPGDHL